MMAAADRVGLWTLPTKQNSFFWAEAHLMSITTSLLLTGGRPCSFLSLHRNWWLCSLPAHAVLLSAEKLLGIINGSVQLRVVMLSFICPALTLKTPTEHRQFVAFSRNFFSHLFERWFWVFSLILYRLQNLTAHLFKWQLSVSLNTEVTSLKFCVTSGLLLHYHEHSCYVTVAELTTVDIVGYFTRCWAADWRHISGGRGRSCGGDGQADGSTRQHWLD